MTYEENNYEKSGREQGIAEKFPVFDLKNRIYRANYTMIMDWLKSRGEVPDAGCFYMYRIEGDDKNGKPMTGWAILTTEQRISRETYDKMGFDTTKDMYHTTLFVINTFSKVALPSDNIHVYPVWMKD